DFKNNANLATEYLYDKNGNLIKDYNKSITEISYNVLNLPQTLKISSATNTYTYAADGRKLKTVLGGSKTTDYCGNVIYENGLLKRILVDGGYIENGTYYFYLTDHLGNNRVIASSSGSIVQSNHYYPFGMSFTEGSATSQQPYKYNGKELDTERGLNLYDYSARLMDPALGRFNMVDPLAKELYSWSPYVYCLDNPIKHIDPDGEFPLIAIFVGGAIDYVSQVAINRIDGKSWSASLTNIDTKSIVVSAAISASGVGLANVIGKASKAIQVSSKVASVLKISGDVAVDATTSAASQLVKEGKIDVKSVVVDVAAGQAGSQLASKVKSIAKNSPEGKVLERQADRAKRVAGDNPRVSRAKRAQSAINKSESYGNKSAIAVGTASSNIMSTFTNKLLEDDKKK
ncbi:MAG: RHS repeat-associated core domain-containing protein, partial [Bacteroides graminisolvens]|nr:RHS repeat-associated core domain-containing protein [Bacteroides graminisolvens]